MQGAIVYEFHYPFASASLSVFHEVSRASRSILTNVVLVDGRGSGLADVDDGDGFTRAAAS